jgi:hypothetical protein
VSTTPAQPQPTAPPEAARPPADAAPRPSDAPPRLRIFHLLIWTVCVGVVMTVVRVPALADAPQRQSLALELYRLAWGAVLGTGLAALPLAATGRMRDIGFPTLAGEWLWIGAGLGAAAWLGFELPHLFIRDFRTSVIGDVPLPIASYCAQIFVYAIGLFSVAQTRWRLYLLVFVGASLGQAGVWCLGTVALSLAGLQPTEKWFVLLTALPVAIDLVWLFATAALDLAQRERYPWTHWTGVAVQLGNRALYLAFWLTTLLAA